EDYSVDSSCRKRSRSGTAGPNRDVGSWPHILLGRSGGRASDLYGRNRTRYRQDAARRIVQTRRQEERRGLQRHRFQCSAAAARLCRDEIEGYLGSTAGVETQRSHSGAMAVWPRENRCIFVGPQGSMGRRLVAVEWISEVLVSARARNDASP